MTENLSAEDAYRRMATIRVFEERALKLSLEGQVAGSIHLALGHEAIPVGAHAALAPQDRIISTYRGHGWALASGSEPVAVLAEIAQRAGGVNGGRGGSAYMSDADHGFLGENSIVGAGAPIADGVAMASVSRGDNRVVLTAFGDGAMNQGSVTEAMVFAAVRNLPVIFLCENNGWSEMTPISSMMRGTDLTERAKGIGIEAHVVDGGDPFAVRDAVAAAAEKARRGEGPIFLECKTVRLKGHYNKDIEHYRPAADSQAAVDADPLVRLRVAEPNAEAYDSIDAEVATFIDRITDEVLAMPLPDASTVLEHLYGPAPTPSPAGPEEVKQLTYQRAVNLALRTELAERDNLLLYGEDVGFAGGIFGVTRGLHKEFGGDRVFDTPISESAILGSAVGAAMEGMRPVVEIMWADFVFVALDQIINQASNVRYISSSRLSAPLTIRMQQGVTEGSCAQHSQSIEAILAHIPGIKVGLVSNPQDGYDMLRAAIADPDPTVIIESRKLYQQTGEVRTGAPTQLAQGARLHREGSDVAIVTWGAPLWDALEAAEQLAAEGIQASVLDLRWVSPIDEAALARAVETSGGRVIVVHEATRTGGFGAEIAAGITERHYAQLAGPVRRVTTPDTRMPSAPALQSALVPKASDIVAAAKIAW